ncbi:MAG: hypothetical protein U1F77_05365 [Kiritimatiellia bacterium]
MLIRMGRYQEAADTLFKAWYRSDCTDARALRLLREAEEHLRSMPPGPGGKDGPPDPGGVHST